MESSLLCGNNANGSNAPAEERYKTTKLCDLFGFTSPKWRNNYTNGIYLSVAAAPLHSSFVCLFPSWVRTSFHHPSLSFRWAEFEIQRNLQIKTPSHEMPFRWQIKRLQVLYEAVKMLQKRLSKFFRGIFLIIKVWEIGKQELSNTFEISIISGLGYQKSVICRFFCTSFGFDWMGTEVKVLLIIREIDETCLLPIVNNWGSHFIKIISAPPTQPSPPFVYR